MSTQPDGAPVSAGARVGRIAQNAAALFRLRVQDARSDVTGSMRRLLSGAAFGLVALVLVLMALPLLVTTAILLLSTVMPAWAAAGIMLVAMLLIAGGLALVGRSRLRVKVPTLLQDLRADWESIRERLEERR